MSDPTSSSSRPPDAAGPFADSPTRDRLRNRHVTLLAVGGCIGVSLFVGIGEAIRTAGAGAVLSYIAGGVVVFLVMRMLGEMAVARPDLGNFVDYARAGLGSWASFSVGWMYWYFFVVIVAFEAVVAGNVVGNWLDVPSWICSLAIMVVFVGLNVYSAIGFGEAEFVLAGVKIATVAVLVIGAAAFVLGLTPGARPIGMSNLLEAPFLTAGFGPVIQGLVIAILSYFGTEIAIIAAVQSQNPQRAVVRTTRLAIIRIVGIFVGSVVALLLVLPFSEIPADSSPFAAAFARLGIPSSEQVVDVVLLVAVLSIVNASVFACSHTLFRLAANGYAPRSLTHRNRRGVPWRAVLLSGTGGVLGTAVNWFAPEDAFGFMLNSAGALALIIYIFVAISQLGLRARMSAAEVARLPIRMWGHPWLASSCALALLGTGVLMLVSPGTRVQAWLSLLALGVVLCAYALLLLSRKRLRTRVETPMPS